MIIENLIAFPPSYFYLSKNPLTFVLNDTWLFIKWRF